MTQKSKIFIVVISLLVGLLHFVIGPDYQGPFPKFARGYLIDIVLPMSLVLLFQLPLREKFSIRFSRSIAGLAVFLIGLTVEILQYFDFSAFGNTFDPLDILMYAVGIAVGLLLDFTLLSYFENQG
jgi:hypothetical protein